MRTSRSPGSDLYLVALAAAAALWLLVIVGGVVRATESGLGCPDWPLCSGRVVPIVERAPVIEFSHRATATAATVLVLAAALIAWRRRLQQPLVARLVFAAALLLPVQALLGATVVWLELPGWIVGVHFAIGMTMLALMVAAATHARRFITNTGGRSSAPVDWLLGVTLATVIAGSVVVSSGAHDACGTSWPTCAGSLTGDDTLGMVQATHRLLALGALVMCSILLVTAWKRRAARAVALLVLVAVGAQTAVGAGMVIVGHHGSSHQALQALHVAGAASVLVVVVAMAAAAAASPAPRPSVPQP